MPYGSHIIAIHKPPFEWDPKKSAINIAKHGVSFFEARLVFTDLNLVTLDDPDHSGDEVRYVVFGCDYKGRVLAVSCCRRDSGRVIRIISARRATRREEREYWRNRYEG